MIKRYTIFMLLLVCSILNTPLHAQEHRKAFARYTKELNRSLKKEDLELSRQYSQQMLDYYDGLGSDGRKEIDSINLFVPHYVVGMMAGIEEDFVTAITSLEKACQVAGVCAESLIDKKIIDGEDLIQCWHMLSESYITVGLFDYVLETSAQMLEVARSYYPSYELSAMAYLAGATCFLADGNEAVELFEQVLESAAATGFDAEHSWAVFYSLHFLCDYYYSEGDYARLIEIAQRYNSVYEPSNDEEWTYYYYTQVYQMKSYSDQGHFARAVEISEKLLEQADHIDTLSPDLRQAVWSNLSFIYNQYYGYNLVDRDLNTKAGLALDRLMSFWDGVEDKEQQVLYTDALISYAFYCTGSEELIDKAEQFYLEAVSLLEQLEVDDTNTSIIYIVNAKLNLARLYHDRGQGDGIARELCLQALEMNDQISGQIRGDDRTVAILLLLANIEYACGNINLSNQYANATYELMLSSDLMPISQSDILKSLSLIYSYVGDSFRAFSTIYNSIQIKESLDIMPSVEDLIAAIYTGIGFFESIFTGEMDEQSIAYMSNLENLCVAGLELLESTPNDAYRSTILMNLAQVYLLKGDSESMDNAQANLLKAGEIRKEIFGEESFDYAVILAWLMRLSTIKEDYDKAFEYAKQTYQIGEQYDNQYMQTNLVEASIKSNNFDYIEGMLMDFFEKNIAHIKYDFTYLSNRERNAYISSNMVIENNYSIAYFLPESQVNRQVAYNTALAVKGLLLNTSQNVESLIRSSGNEALIAEYRSVAALRESIVSVRDSVEYENLTFGISQREKRLQEAASEYGDFTAFLDLRWEDVAAALGEDDVAVEFVSFVDAWTEYYMALVLRKGWQSPVLVDLCQYSQLQRHARNGANMYRDAQSRDVYELVWLKLEEYMAPGENVYFSASGLLNQMNIEVLLDSASVPANQRYNMYRISSTGQLCNAHSNAEYSNATLYGGLDYDMDDELLIAQSRSYSSEGAMRSAPAFEADGTRAGWTYLPYTKSEVENISAIMLENGVKAVVFDSINGTEESFKALSGQKNAIVHIATHGFYVQADQVSRSGYTMNSYGGQQFNSGMDRIMDRSGLMLSGGQRAWLGQSVPEGVEDGVLLAEEIAAMDLSVTDLVVLSACETGLGDIQSEGVYGLQRAFKQAGVQTILMSLWRVGDRATAIMMQHFYEELLSGKSKHEAFAIAQQAVKKAFPNPRFWAAFIMLD